MPGWDDLARLPYLQAFVKEVLRWRPVVPGGIHHLTTKQDHYMGYEIPADTPIIPNHWSLEFDSRLFPNPKSFIPERWLENPDLPCSAFGFGRRVCPGKNLALNSLRIVMARILCAFDIRSADEMAGKSELPDSWDMTQGISSRPALFRALFCCRCEQRGQVIEGEWAACEKDIQVLMEQVKSNPS
jgi:cytochrome P450